MSYKFDRDKFWAGFRSFYKDVTGIGLEQDKVDAVEFLLTQFEASPLWRSIPEIAYAFATMHIETFWPASGSRYLPIKEGGGPAYFHKYDGRKDLGNDHYGDGAKFKGRGFVQITGRKNYTTFSKLLGVDLVGNPDLALDPATAFQIMTLGMTRGLFTGKTIGEFVDDGHPDYYNARTVINGHNRAGEIAGYAKHFEQILNDSDISDAPAADPPKPELAPAEVTVTPAQTLESPPSTPEDQAQPESVVSQPLISQVSQEVKPTIWERLTGYKEKADQVSALSGSVSHISTGSSFMTWITKAGGWGVLSLGFFKGDWIVLIVGLALIGLAIYFYSRSKDRANARVIAAPPTPVTAEIKV